jgi:2,4-dienoyl-CoA reductase-like NADH-dependent reductase (Old Yellow Enzyme family)
MEYPRIGTLKTEDAFHAHLKALDLDDLPFEGFVESGPTSPLGMPLTVKSNGRGLTVGNRWCIHPMEGWDGTTDGKPSEYTLRRWQRFGHSGAKLIWGGEAVAVRPDGRANPNQLVMNDANQADIAALRDALIEEHVKQTGSDAGLVIGLQLTHSGRFCRPHDKKLEPRIAYHHPILDKKFGIGPDDDSVVFTDDELKKLIDAYVVAAKKAAAIGFDFVDIKHCHGYLGHELLSGHTRPGAFGGSLENRTRFLRQIVAGIRAEAPDLHIGVRLSAFDMPPFRPDPTLTQGKTLGPGIPEPFAHLLPYRYAFGCNPQNPLEVDLTETAQLLEIFRGLGIALVNLSAGSPYYNPHIQRPALYPPSDGYQPPEDPVLGCVRQMRAVRDLKAQFPDLLLVGTGYTYFQEFLPQVAQAAVRQGWVDSVGVGRMVLSYPSLPHDVVTGRELQTKLICRTFSDCTTAPRNGLISGCYPLDERYKKSEQMVQLKRVKSSQD